MARAYDEPTVPAPEWCNEHRRYHLLCQREDATGCRPGRRILTTEECQQLLEAGRAELEAGR